MKNIEQLEKEVNEIKNSLNALKNNVKLSENEKKSQAQTLKSHAEITKQNIQSKIDSLKNKTDSESKQEIEKAQILLNTINEIFTLYDSILNSSQPKPTQTVQQNDKDIFTKAKDWIGEQWESVWDSGKWKRSSEGGKNVLRTAGFLTTGVGAVALAYKGLKKLWNWAFSDDEDEVDDKDDAENTQETEDESGDDESEEESDKKSFWNSGRGKFLKGVSIVSVIGGGYYYLKKRYGKEKEAPQEAGISESMFQQLLQMEGSQDFVAKIHKSKFGESFVTGPYGMVYKHIDANGNLLNTPVAFKNGERVTQEWAEKNARAYYNKRAKRWKSLLDEKGYKYTQDMLDALVCASGGTAKSVKSLENYVLSHRDDKDAIYNFMIHFATTAAGNGKVMPGLVSRRRFEANWFAGTKRPYSDYQRNLA